MTIKYPDTAPLPYVGEDVWGYNVLRWKVPARWGCRCDSVDISAIKRRLGWTRTLILDWHTRRSAKLPPGAVSIEVLLVEGGGGHGGKGGGGGGPGVAEVVEYDQRSVKLNKWKHSCSTMTEQPKEEKRK